MAGGATIVSRPAEGPAIVVHGNIHGSIQLGNNNIQVNDAHGDVVINRIQSVRRERPTAPPPRAPAPFIGRSEELTRLASTIAGGSSAVLVGDPGAGRSALLRRAAANAASSLRILAIQGYGDAGPSLEPDDLAQRLFDLVWETEPRDKVTVATASAELASVTAMALIDDIDLPDGDLERVGDILPGRSMLLSSRQSSFLDWLEDVPLGALPRHDSIALLRARAALAASPDDDSSLDAICGLLGDWPGALAIAGRAMAVRQMTVTAARDVLGQAGTSSLNPHLAAIERAYALAQPALDANARSMLATAASMPALTTDPDVLRRVLGNPDWFELALEQLKQLDLLRLNSPRLRLPAGLTSVLAGRDPSRVGDRYVAELVRLLTERRLDWEFIEGELGGALASIDRAQEEGDAGTAIALGRALSPYLVLHGLWGIATNVFETVRTAAERVGDQRTAAWANHELGTLALAGGDASIAVSLLTKALDARMSLGDTEGAAYTRHNLARLQPPPISGFDGGGGGNRGTGGSGFRLPIVTLVIAFLVIASLASGVGPALGNAVSQMFRSSTPAPAATAPLPTDTDTPAPTDTPVPTDTPAATDTPAPTDTPTPEPLSLNQTDGTVKLDGIVWAGSVTLTAIGGIGPYEIDLSDGQTSQVNPASFAVKGMGCETVDTATASSADGQKVGPVSFVLAPDECGQPGPGVPAPTGPDYVASCSSTTLAWTDGGGVLPSTYDVILTLIPKDGSSTQVLEQPTNGLSLDVSLPSCGTYEFTVEAIDALGRRSGASVPHQFQAYLIG